MELILGLDLSLTGSALAVVVRATKKLYEKPVTFSNNLTGPTRLAYIRTELLCKVHSLKAEHKLYPVFIEGYGFAFRGKEYTLAELGGLIRLGLLEYVDVSYYDVPPNSLKLYITGKGNSNKAIMLEQVYRKYKIGSEILKDDNQVDAFSLAQFGIDYLNWKDGKMHFPKRVDDTFRKIETQRTIDCARAYII